MLLPVLGGAGGVGPAPGHCPIGGMLTHTQRIVTISCLQDINILHTTQKTFLVFVLGSPGLAGSTDGSDGQI